MKNKLEYESKPFGDYWPFVFAQMGCLLPNIAQVQVEKKYIVFVYYSPSKGRKSLYGGPELKKICEFQQFVPCLTLARVPVWPVAGEAAMNTVNTYTYTYIHISL